MTNCLHCERPRYARGFCIAHYCKFMKYGDALEPSHIRTLGTCTECDVPELCKGLCMGHYHKLRRTGVRGGQLRRSRTPLERYASFVDHRGPDECWPWTGHKTQGGYGFFDQGNAHRFGFSQLVRPLEPDEDVDHTCHNGTGCYDGDACKHRACQNPAHWEAVPGIVNTLRGESVFAVNARKVKCKWGHELTPENSYGYKGLRQCKTCARLAARGVHPRQLLAAGRLF